MRASVLLVMSMLKTSLLIVVGLGTGLLLAPMVVHAVRPAWDASGWTSPLDAVFVENGARADEVDQWLQPAYVRARWADFSAVLDAQLPSPPSR